MTAHRVNYDNRVGFGIELENGMWKVRFAKGELRLIHKNNLTIFSKQPVRHHTYMDTRVLDTNTARRLFKL